MADPLKHAEKSARKFGGKPEDYLPIHSWFDESKAFLADFRHRALRGWDAFEPALSRAERI